MPKDIYSQIFTKLDRLTHGLDSFFARKGYLKLKSAGFMDLVIEKIGDNTISIAHYYEQNGDLVADPDITIKIYPDQKQAEALTFQNWISYMQVYPEENKVNLKLKKDLNSFLNFWLRNLKNQGFYK